MPSFLKDLRRKSRSFHSQKALSERTDGSSNDSANGNVRYNKSSSTLNSGYGSATPPSTLPSESSFVNGKSPTNGLPPLPQRPSNITKRYSINSNTSTNGNERAFPATSLLAPRITSISDNSWVNQKVLLIYGQIGEAAHKLLDGSVQVNHHLDSFPATSWAVNDSNFKALVHLQPGPNRIRLDFYSPKVSSGSTSKPSHSSWININYLPLNVGPPLQLVIILAKDSPCVYDAVPERVQREGNGLATAIRKYRMAAYLWQAFTGEQMYRNGFGRRNYHYEEEWQPGTLSFQDFVAGTMRSEAKVHIIRSERTVKEIQDLDVAQQHGPAKRKGDLFQYAMDACKSYFGASPGQTHYVAAMFLDSHWDTKEKVVRGHAALGGGNGEIQLSIFGSHLLQAYPACLEDVAGAFTDCTRTDTNHVANDCNESGSVWEAANIGIGAHLHEVGHLFGSPHQESGVMLRDYTRFNRTFITRESYSTRTKSQGLKLCQQQDECAWHRLDCLRFRFHPCFRSNIDPPMIVDPSAEVWTVDNNSILVTAPSGISFIEIYCEGDDVCHSFIDYLDPNVNSGSLPRQVALSESDVRSRLPADAKGKRIKLEVHSAGEGRSVVEDLSRITNPKFSRVKMPDNRYGFRSSRLGYSNMEGSEPQELIFQSAYIQTKLMVAIRVYHSFAVHGVEFIYEDQTTQMFGKRGGNPGGDEFVFDTRRGEMLMGFAMRTGLWIDGIQVLTTLGRKSAMFGNPTGGGGHTLIPPRAYNIVGISGSCAQWLDGFSLIIAR